jgi:hypothetical protein
MHTIGGCAPTSGFNQTILQQAHQQICKVTSFYSRNHSINSKNWLLFECCFALLVTFVGLMEGEVTLKSCQTNLCKDDRMKNSKYTRLHLAPVHDDIESTSRTTLSKAGGDDTGWLSDTTKSCVSTTSILKSDIIEAGIIESFPYIIKYTKGTRTLLLMLYLGNLCCSHNLMLTFLV